MGGFLFVDPPGVEIHSLAYRFTRVAEAVPVGDMEGAAVPIGHQIPVPQQNPVQCARRVAQRFARVLGVQEPVADGDLEVVVSAPMIVELAWYLEHRLRWSRSRSASRLVQLIDSDGVIVLDLVVAPSLELFRRNRRLDFVDAYLAAGGQSIGPPVVAALDRDFDRIDGVTRIGS